MRHLLFFSCTSPSVCSVRSGLSVFLPGIQKRGCENRILLMIYGVYWISDTLLEKNLPSRLFSFSQRRASLRTAARRWNA